MTPPHNCPICSAPADRRCRCPKGDSVCVRGHHWHYCLAHGVPRLVLGPSDHTKDTFACSCGIGKGESK